MKVHLQRTVAIRTVRYQINKHASCSHGKMHIAKCAETFERLSEPGVGTGPYDQISKASWIVAKERNMGCASSSAAAGGVGGAENNRLDMQLMQDVSATHVLCVFYLLFFAVLCNHESSGISTAFGARPVSFHPPPFGWGFVLKSRDLAAPCNGCTVGTDWCAFVRGVVSLRFVLRLFL